MFIMFYSKLTKVFHNEDYLPHLVVAGIIAPYSVRHLSSLPSWDRAMRVLDYILYSLQGGEKEPFHKMLEVMQEHGNLHAQSVAEEITKTIVSGVNSVAKTYSLGSITRTKSDSIGSVASFRNSRSTTSDYSMESFSTSEGKNYTRII